MPEKERKRRRTSIPPRQNSAFSLWSLLRNFVGRDISRIPMPVNYNEPLSFLQRITEDMDYSFLLDKAADEADAAAQMTLVAGFAVAFYAVQHERMGKPFNPLLGETFECDRMSEKGWRTIAEQVSHHPPISAQLAEGTKGWKREMVFHADPKLRGNYMSVVPKGVEHLFFNKSGTHYSWNKVSTTVHNMIIGRLWIDQHGDVRVLSHTNDLNCFLHFYSYHNSFLSREAHHEANKVIGVVASKTGKPLWALKGRWDSHMDRAPVLGWDDEDSVRPIVDEKSAVKAFYHLLLHDWTSLWTKKPPIANYEDMYHMSGLAVELNEPESGVAPSDSRLRPDQRRMEDGQWDAANQEKLRLEEKQRENRKKNKGGGEASGGFWFSEESEDGSGERVWRLKRDYWDAKRRQDWSGVPQLF